MLAVLLLRGEQTPGELKQRTERMQPFATIEELHEVLTRLIDRELVVAARAPPRPEGGALPPPALRRPPRTSRRRWPPRPRPPSSRRRRAATSAWTARARGRRAARRSSATRCAARGAPRAARRTRSMSAFEVPPERLGAWLERWADEHDATPHRDAPGPVTFTGADGAQVVGRAAVPAAGPGRRGRGFAPERAARPRHARPHRRRPARAPRRLRGRRLLRQAARGLQGRRAPRPRPQPAPAGRARSATSAAATASRGSPTTRRRRPARGSCCAHFDDLDAVVLGGDRFALATVLEDPRAAQARAPHVRARPRRPRPAPRGPARDAGPLPATARTLDPRRAPEDGAIR